MSALDRFQVEDLLREAGRRSPGRLRRAWCEVGREAIGHGRGSIKSVSYIGKVRRDAEPNPAAGGVPSHSPDCWSTPR